jgi:hypothetical protein
MSLVEEGEQLFVNVFEPAALSVQQVAFQDRVFSRSAQTSAGLEMLFGLVDTAGAAGGARGEEMRPGTSGPNRAAHGQLVQGRREVPLLQGLSSGKVMMPATPVPGRNPNAHGGCEQET